MKRIFVFGFWVSGPDHYIPFASAPSSSPDLFSVFIYLFIYETIITERPGPKWNGTGIQGTLALSL
jgi:hypothetical protein